MANHCAALKEHARPDQLARLTNRGQPSAMHDMLLLMQKHEMGIVARTDEHYPQELLNIPDPPHFLYWIGDLTCTEGRCITMVGSRSASLAALEATKKIAHDLSSQGVRVVSGMAVGIDQAAHTGCLEGESPTIAVLACGLDVDYPSGSEELKKQIVEQGGVLISEYAPGSPAVGWRFPVRNRILAGLSRAVVMMEGKPKSGSMTTVQHALDQGREVYAWPGHAGTEWA